MPSIEYNKTWAERLQRFQMSDQKYSYYGEYWGNPDWGRLRYWTQRILGTPPLRRIFVKILGKDFFRLPPGDLSYVVKAYIEPNVTSGSTVLEIGPGGGRWTKYLLHARTIVLVELNPIFFDYLNDRFPGVKEKFRCYQTAGDELNGIESASVDFVFTFGTFVHLEPEVIQSYLQHIERVLRPGGMATLQYADKTKPAAQKIDIFSNMTAEKMEAFVTEIPTFRIITHNLRLLNHSNIIVLGKQGQRHVQRTHP